jgi:hypothetical protein
MALSLYAQLLAHQNVDNPAYVPLQALCRLAYSRLRNFLRTGAQEVAHFLPKLRVKRGLDDKLHQ